MRRGRRRSWWRGTISFWGVNRAVEALLRTLTPALSQGEREEERSHYRGGFQVAGMVERARELREKQTPAAEVLWELLRDRQCGGAKFRRQHQFGDYICDFYCHATGLVVECDGEVHDSDEAKAHDKKRDAYLRSQKVKVLRFKNSSVLHKTEEVLTDILIELPSTSGRGAGGEGSTSKNRIGVFWHTRGSGKSYSISSARSRGRCLRCSRSGTTSSC